MDKMLTQLPKLYKDDGYNLFVDLLNFFYYMQVSMIYIVKVGS